MRFQLSPRLFNPWLVAIVALLMLLGATGFAAAQTTPPDATPTPGPSLIPELQGIPREQRFDHFVSAQFTITDAQGNPATYVMTPGTVSALNGNMLSVTPNGQSTATTYTITANTLVRGQPARGSTQALAVGDKVVVMTKQGSTDAVVVAKHGPKMGGFHGMGGHGMMGGW